MTVEWLNDELTEAMITRGVWRWRRRALVDQIDGIWRFTISRTFVGDRLSVFLMRGAVEEAHRRQHEMDWMPVTARRKRISI